MATTYPSSIGDDLTNRKDLIIGIDVVVDCPPDFSTVTEGGYHSGMSDV